jgi:NAD(P)-dependent dehydrogenase (short-subunit alcohol dehydrogenase family)
MDQSCWLPTLLVKGIPMRPTTSHDTAGMLLLGGASRGLGLAMAAEFLKRGWNVVGTVRGSARTKLHDLADEYEGRVEIESLDITEPDQIAALYDRLSGRGFDIQFSNAGTGNADDGTTAEVSTEQFVRVMVTNALSPMRVIEGLHDLVPANGLIGIISSVQGSVSNNENGGHEVYRGSKAALNQCMRSYAARHAGEPPALILMDPHRSWRTERTVQCRGGHSESRRRAALKVPGCRRLLCCPSPT